MLRERRSSVSSMVWERRPVQKNLDLLPEETISALDGRPSPPRHRNLLLGSPRHRNLLGSPRHRNLLLGSPRHRNLASCWLAAASQPAGS